MQIAVIPTTETLAVACWLVEILMEAAVVYFSL
jgi:hypothetical protein